MDTWRKNGTQRHKGYSGATDNVIDRLNKTNMLHTSTSNFDFI
jgi:hypothetical protein